MLPNVLYGVQQFPRTGLLSGVNDPYLGQALIGRNFTGHSGQVLTLHGSRNPVENERIGPQCRNE